MHKFSARTMIIFVVCLLLAVIILGLGTAYVSKFKQQRRQLSDNSLFKTGTRGNLAGQIARRPTWNLNSSGGGAFRQLSFPLLGSQMPASPGAQTRCSCIAPLIDDV